METCILKSYFVVGSLRYWTPFLSVSVRLCSFGCGTCQALESPTKYIGDMDKEDDWPERYSILGIDERTLLDLVFYKCEYEVPKS